VPAVILMVIEKLCLKMRRIKGFDFSLPEPFSLTDIVEARPLTKIKIKYHFSVDIALKRAKERDDVGKRTKWFLPGGPERQEATELYR